MCVFKWLLFSPTILSWKCPWFFHGTNPSSFRNLSISILIYIVKLHKQTQFLNLKKYCAHNSRSTKRDNYYLKNVKCFLLIFNKVFLLRSIASGVIRTRYDQKSNSGIRPNVVALNNQFTRLPGRLTWRLGQRVREK